MRIRILMLVLINMFLFDLSIAQDSSPVVQDPEKKMEEILVNVNRISDLKGIGGYVSGLAQKEFSDILATRADEWVVDSVAEFLENEQRTENGRVRFKLSYLDSKEVRKKVEAAIEKKMREELPKLAGKFIKEKIFSQVIDDDAKEEIKRITDKIKENLDRSLNSEYNKLASQWYKKGLKKLREKMEFNVAGIPIEIEPTNIKKSIKSIIESNVAETTINFLNEQIGASTVNGIRSHLQDAFDGKLPKELIDAMTKGQGEFDKYMAMTREHMPMAQWSKLKDSILNKPFIKLPTPAYAVVLAASASDHFSKAFAAVGIFGGPDPYELMRAIEVLKVLAWQVNDKEYINISLMQLSQLTSVFAAKIGMAGSLDKLMKPLKDKMTKLDEMVKKLDKIVGMPLDKVQEKMKELTDEITKQLKGIQDEIINELKKQANNVKGKFNDWVKPIKDKIDMVPDGVPKTWAKFRDKVGLPKKPFGKFGDVTPGKVMKEIDKKMKITEGIEKFKKDLAKLNELIAKKIAKIDGAIVERLMIIHPNCDIKDVEKVPAQNVSDKSEFDPVLLHNGEFFHRVVDFSIPGRGVDFVFERVYRSRTNFMGELGNNWTHSFAARILPWESEEGFGATYFDDSGIKQFFLKEDGGFKSPKGIFSKLIPTETGYKLSNPDGSSFTFDELGRILKKCDRYDNCLRMIYGDVGELVKVLDFANREIVFKYNEAGLLSEIEDFAGRQFKYDYDEDHNLIGVKLPSTYDFPDGRITGYRYSSGHENDELNHNLTKIMDPSGNLFLLNEYGDAGEQFDKVSSQQYGKEGFRIHAKYSGKTVEIADSLGNVRAYSHDDEGHLISRHLLKDKNKILLDGYEYDEDGNMIKKFFTDGSFSAMKYKNGNPVEITGRNFGNKSSQTHFYEYESEYNRISREVGSDGLETTYQYLLADDGEEILVSKKKDSKELGMWRYFYDNAGDLVSVESPDKRVVQYEYLSSGVLGSVFKMIDDKKIGVQFKYDLVGNVIEKKDFLGNVHKYKVDQLNRLTEEILSSGIKRRYSYDANGNMSGVNVLDREKKHSGFMFKYDELDRLVEKNTYDGDKNLIDRVVDGSRYHGLAINGTESMFFPIDRMKDVEPEIFSATDPLKTRNVLTDLKCSDIDCNWGLSAKNIKAKKKG